MPKDSTCDSRHQVTVRTASTRCGAILGHTPAWQRATGGESLGVPPSHDWQREVAVDELARAAAPAEQTRSDSSWSATRRLCLHKAIQLTATLVGVAMSAFESEHNPGRVPTVRQKETSS